MFLISLLSLVMVVCYALGLMAVYIHWRRDTWPGVEPSTTSDLQPRLSVLVAARNEAPYIAACCRAVMAQTYPHERFELIVIDDHSTDTTAAIVAALGGERLRLLSLADYPMYGMGKKAALQLGIDHSWGDYIVTTDADCLPGRGWLAAFARGFAQGYEMLLAPVRLTAPTGFLGAWQGLDVAGTMLLTGATAAWGYPLLANGANFGYAKSWYLQLGGHRDDRHRASGDDIFLLQKAVRHNRQGIAFLPQTDAVVATQPAATWRDLFWQRIRWAAKTGAYRDVRLVLFQAGVYALCGLLLLGGMGCLWWPAYLPWIASAWGVKLLADAVYLHYACRRLGDLRWMRWFLPAQVLHVVYVVVIGSLALLPIRFDWKGRRVV